MGRVACCHCINRHLSFIWHFMQCQIWYMLGNILFEVMLSYDLIKLSFSTSQIWCISWRWFNISWPSIICKYLFRIMLGVSWPVWCRSMSFWKSVVCQLEIILFLVVVCSCVVVYCNLEHNTNAPNLNLPKLFSISKFYFCAFLDVSRASFVGFRLHQGGTSKH